MNKGLFTTLDTVVGKLKTPFFEQPILISDTIGFISNLPPVLIDSFRSTLYESLEAKLLLHVVAADDPQLFTKIEVVENILDSLGAEQPRILVLNKVDQLSHRQRELLAQQVQEFITAQDESPAHKKIIDNIFVSAATGDQLAELTETLSRFFAD